MAATYDRQLVTNIDWVRFLTADTDIDSPRLHDETIAALLAEKGENKYLAAALAMDLGGLQLTDGNVKTKIVGDLQITYGGKTSDDRMRAYIKNLQTRGTWILLRTNRVAEVL